MTSLFRPEGEEAATRVGLHGTTPGCLDRAYGRSLGPSAPRGVVSPRTPPVHGLLCQSVGMKSSVADTARLAVP